MDFPTQTLQNLYDEMQVEKTRIRQEIRNKYSAIIKQEIDKETEDVERAFAKKLKEAKDLGMKRADIARAIRTNDGKKMKHFLDLAGAEGFRVPAEYKPHTNQGPVILKDIKNGVVEVLRVGKVPVKPFLARVRWHKGIDYTYEPFEGSDVSEFTRVMQNEIDRDVRRGIRMQIRKVFVRLEELGYDQEVIAREELEAKGIHVVDDSDSVEWFEMMEEN